MKTALNPLPKGSETHGGVAQGRGMEGVVGMADTPDASSVCKLLSPSLSHIFLTTILPRGHPFIHQTLTAHPYAVLVPEE